MDEYIDRANLIARIEYYVTHTPEGNGEHYAYSVVLNEVLNLPDADVAPVVHGRKIEDGDIGCFWLCSLCSECLPYGANYCPNCGAKMDGRGEK